MARGGGALPDYPERPDLRAHGRNRRGRDDVVTGGDRRSAELGLPLLLAAGRDLHALRTDECRLSRRIALMAAMAFARHCRKRFANADHVRCRWRTAAQ